MDKDEQTEAEYKQKLTPEEYAVLREGKTEAPFSGEYVNTREDGMFHCRACGAPLFASDVKFESNVPGLAGWPSFEDAIPGSVEFREDSSLGLRRTEVVCTRCGSHLGHLFDDKLESKTGKHFCINSCALKFEEK